MFLQNIFEPDICARKSKVFRLYLHIAPRPFASSQSRRNKGVRGAISPPQILAGIEAKPSPSKGLGLLFAPHPNGFSYLPTALQVWLQQAISQ